MALWHLEHFSGANVPPNKQTHADTQLWRRTLCIAARDIWFRWRFRVVDFKA